MPFAEAHRETSSDWAVQTMPRTSESGFEPHAQSGVGAMLRSIEGRMSDQRPIWKGTADASMPVALGVIMIAGLSLAAWLPFLLIIWYFAI